MRKLVNAFIDRRCDHVLVFSSVPTECLVITSSTLDNATDCMFYFPNYFTALSPKIILSANLAHFVGLISISCADPEGGGRGSGPPA